MPERPVREVCEVLARTRAGVYHELVVVAPRIAAAARPGQFVEVQAGTGRWFLLRRPFSIHRVERSGPALGTVSFVFDVIGPGTAVLAGLRGHDTIDLIGPLGTSFTIPGAPASCLLVGGGYGVAPLFFLAEDLHRQGCRIDYLIGASTAERLFKVMEAKRGGSSTVVTTDDGSSGRRGIVTDAMPDLIARSHTERVYACGPMPMLAAVTRVAATHGLPCEVAVEEQMACGTGICFSCVVPVLDGGEATRLARTCTEGPVFDGKVIAWHELGHAAAGIPPDEELVP